MSYNDFFLKTRAIYKRNVMYHYLDEIIIVAIINSF